MDLTDKHKGVPAPRPKDPEAALTTGSPPVLGPLPITPDLDPPGAGKLGLSPEEIEQFRTRGFVVKRGLIPRSEFAPFIDLWWRQPPVTRAGFSPDQRGWSAPGRHWPDENRWGLATNWMGYGDWPAPDDERPGATVGERVGRLPYKLTRDRSNDVWRWHGIGHDPAFVDATSAHPRMLYIVEALLGGPVKRPRRNRGIYAVFPRDPEAPASRLGPHMDQSMTEISAVTYLDDVPPNSGGFTIYPTSPQLLYPTSEQALNWVATERSDDMMDRIKTEVQPLEFTGKAGDVIFCHGWMVHSAGIHETNRIRMAAVQDFNKVRERSHMRWTAAGKNGGPRINGDMDGVFTFTGESDDDPADGYREVTIQWIMDSNEFVLARPEPFDDMFREWNLGQRPVEGNVVDEPAWWEKYGLPLPPSAGKPRGAGGTPAVPLANIAEYEGNGTWRATSRANDWMSR